MDPSLYLQYIPNLCGFPSSVKHEMYDLLKNMKNIIKAVNSSYLCIIGHKTVLFEEQTQVLHTNLLNHNRSCDM